MLYTLPCQDECQPQMSIYSGLVLHTSVIVTSFYVINGCLRELKKKKTV